MTPRPPRLAEGLLRRLLPDGVRGASILRDLRVEYASLARERGVPPRLWYWKEALALGGHYLLHRLRDRARAPGPPLSSVLSGLVGHDLRYAFRRLMRNPSFSLVVVLTLALGVGATVTIFSVVDAVLLTPLPYEAPEELVAVWEHHVPRDRRRNVANPGNYRDWRARSETFDDLAAVTMVQSAVLTSPGEPTEARTRYTTGNYFELLGMEPLLGNLPEVVTQDEGEPQVLLSHRFWQRRFGADPEIVGRSITLNGVSGVVVGVLSPEYIVFGDETEIFAAVPISGDQTSSGRFLNVVGRLADGVGIEAAREEMETIAAGLREEYPDYNAGWSVNVVPFREDVVGDVRAGTWFLMGAVGLLLLIACVNVAGLLLARAAERRREMAVRTSLGAGRTRLGVQLLIESLLLAGVGSLAGLALAHLGTRVVAGSLPGAFALPRVESAGLNGTVLLFTLGITVLTGLLFGLAPAVHAARTEPAGSLTGGGRQVGRDAQRFRHALVVVEIAVSLVLLIGAGLMARSFTSLIRVDAGFDPEGVTTARVTVTGDRYQGSEPDRVFFTRLLSSLAEVPGMEAAGAVTWLPMTGLAAGTSYYPEGRRPSTREEWPVADVRNVAGDYFAAMGIDLLRGRVFDARDRPDAPDVAVVSRTLAERAWPDGDAVGERLRLSWSELEDLEVIGVVEDVHHNGLADDPRGTVYLSYRQKPWFNFMVLALRSDLDQGVLVKEVEERLRTLDPSVPLADVRPMEAVLGRSVARPRTIAVLTVSFAGLALLLTLVGLYGLLTYTVSRRVREIGIRMAVGAGVGDVVRMVVRRGMTLVAFGGLIGAFGGLAAGTLVENLLFGVGSRDLVSVATALALLLLVGLVASSVPAWRAARVAPARALRVE